MEFYHVSIDLKEREKEFIPRIPKYRCLYEDNVSNRICVCPSLREAISAFPYKCQLVNMSMRRKKNNYLMFYKVESDNYVSSEELKEKVPDAYITNEHWILEPFNAIGELIKINKIKLSQYNKYCNDYSGEVKELEYEKETENYDREAEFILLSKRNLKKFEKICKRENIKVEILEDKHVCLEYLYLAPTTKHYRWIKVKLSIPAGSNMRDLWLIDDEQNNFAIKKKMIIKEFKCMEFPDLMDLWEKDYEKSKIA